MSTTIQSAADHQLLARRIILRGRVQGIGIRPTIYRLATRIGLMGAVRNSAHGVEIHIEGTTRQLSQLANEVKSEISSDGGIDLNVEIEDASRQGYATFSIERSVEGSRLSTVIPTDLAVCFDCLRDCQDFGDRRYRYPLTSCTQCGPRYSVIQRMPYERSDTTMAHFELCESCQTEYESPLDRRFHAQTNACSNCGPHVWCTDEKGREVARADDAIDLAIHWLSIGKIIALRGIGGYQLLVDATNRDAVRRLRERKRRAKPLALLVDSIQVAKTLAFLNQVEQDALADASNPIVLLRAKSSPDLASDVIHPGLDTVGLMLPTTPLHALMSRGVNRPLVCTSGNVEGEPLEYEIDDAQTKLVGICDLWIHHNRPIARPIDDSVVRVIADRCVTIRLSRGLAPLPLDLSSSRPMLALGGYLKSAAAWSNGVQAVLGPHVGDHSTLASRERFLEQCQDWQQLYRFEPNCIVHDRHPEYFTTSWANKQNIPAHAIQHHHAHIVAGMLEQGWLDRQVLGVAWDGTGYGTDGTIWGGEFLVATAKSFERVAGLRPFQLPGGEAAIREPWRIAVALATALARDSNLEAAQQYLAELNSCEAVDSVSVRVVQQITNAPHLSPTTTSVGRLFDAAAALILGVTHAEFDGQAAMMLESAAAREAPGEYSFPLLLNEVKEFDWRPLFAELLADRIARVDPAAMAMKFHRTMASAVMKVSCQFPELPVVLGGGVFQNRLLTELIAELFCGDSRELGLPGVIPPNDGGLAAGQLAIATAWQE